MPLDATQPDNDDQRHHENERPAHDERLGNAAATPENTGATGETGEQPAAPLPDNAESDALEPTAFDELDAGDDDPAFDVMVESPDVTAPADELESHSTDAEFSDDMPTSPTLAAPGDGAGMLGGSSLTPDIPFSFPATGSEGDSGSAPARAPLIRLASQRTGSSAPGPTATPATGKSNPTPAPSAPSKAPTSSPGSTSRAVVQVSLSDVQLRRTVQELLDRQVDRDAHLLETLVTRKIAAAFTQRAVEKRVAYGE